MTSKLDKNKTIYNYVSPQKSKILESLPESEIQSFM
jgi:hypothetical protein